MSITLVASLPKQNAVLPTDNVDSDENAADLANFASLLFSQLMLSEPEVAEKKEAADIPEMAFSPEDAVAAFIAPLIAARDEHLAQSGTGTSATDLAEEGDSVAALLIGADKPEAKPSETLDPLASVATSAKPTDSPAETALADKSSAKIADLPSAAAQPASQTMIQPKQAERSVLDLVDPSQEKPVTNTPVMTNQASNHPAVQEREMSFSVPTPVRDSAWASDFSNKILWMVNNGKQSAQLTLNPAQMGPVEISLSIDKGHVSANFVSTNAEVRETLESALPRLREMFASAGIELGQTNVGAESFHPPTDQKEAGRSASQGLDDEAILAAEDAEVLISTVATTQASNHRVDLFA